MQPIRLLKFGFNKKYCLIKFFVYIDLYEKI